MNLSVVCRQIEKISTSSESRGQIMTYVVTYVEFSYTPLSTIFRARVCEGKTP